FRRLVKGLRDRAVLVRPVGGEDLVGPASQEHVAAGAERPGGAAAGEAGTGGVGRAGVPTTPRRYRTPLHARAREGPAGGAALPRLQSCRARLKAGTDYRARG